MTNELQPTAPQSNAELLRLAQEGNEDAFATIFHTHRIKVYSLCLRMTCNTAEAEDLTQDAFLQVFRKIGSFRGDSALSTWLYRVAYNTVLMRFRKKGLREMSLDEPSNREPGAPTREYGAVDARLSASIDRIAITRAMKELPAGYRTVFLMHQVKGYEHHEIARLLRCSIGNSKSQLHRAKAKMRELMALAKPQPSTRVVQPKISALPNLAMATAISMRQPDRPRPGNQAAQACNPRIGCD